MGSLTFLFFLQGKPLISSWIQMPTIWYKKWDQLHPKALDVFSKRFWTRHLEAYRCDNGCLIIKNIELYLSSLKSYFCFKKKDPRLFWNNISPFIFVLFRISDTLHKRIINLRDFNIVFHFIEIWNLCLKEFRPFLINTFHSIYSCTIFASLWDLQSWNIFYRNSYFTNLDVI